MMKRLKTTKDEISNYYKNFTLKKLIIISVLMLFSFKYTNCVNILLMFSIFSVLTENEFDGFYLLFFLINFRFVFRYNLNGNIPYIIIVFYIYAIFSIVKYFFIKKEKPDIDLKCIVLSLFYLIYILISLLIRKGELSFFIKHLTMIFMINYVFTFRNKIDYKKLILYFIAGTITAFGIELITQYIFNEQFISMDLAVKAMEQSRHRGLAGDPNYYSLDLILSLSGLFYLILSKKINQYLSFTLNVILTICIYFTYSKSVAIGFIVLISLMLICAIGKGVKNTYKDMFRIILGVIVAFVIIRFVFLKDIFIVFNRFNENFLVNGSSNSESTQMLNSITTGRWTLWKNHLEYVISSLPNFLFGGGVGTYVQPVEAHNTYIQMIYELGAIGILPLIVILIIILKKVNIKKDLKSFSNLMNLIMFLSGALMMANVNYLAVTSFVYHLTLMFCTIGKNS